MIGVDAGISWAPAASRLRRAVYRGAFEGVLSSASCISGMHLRTLYMVSFPFEFKYQHVHITDAT